MPSSSRMYGVSKRSSSGSAAASVSPVPLVDIRPRGVDFTAHSATCPESSRSMYTCTSDSSDNFDGRQHHHLSAEKAVEGPPEESRWERFLNFMHYLALRFYSGPDIDRQILLNNSGEDSELNNLYLLEQNRSLFKWVHAFKGTGKEAALDFLYRGFRCEERPSYLEDLAQEATKIYHLHPKCWWCPTVAKANVFLQRGIFEDSTPFHIAVLFNNVGMAKALLSLCPWYLDVTYEAATYRGEHALHIAVVNCLKSEYWAPELGSGAYRDGVHSPSNDMLMFLVESKSDRLERKKMLNDAHTTGTFFDRKSEYHLVNWGQTPLSFAACLYLPRVMEYLVNEGADIFATDGEGNNILHLLAMQVPGCSTKGEPCPKTTAQEAKRLIDMCTYVMQLACGVRHGTTEYTCLEKQMNKNGMKPLHVAADYGNVELFKFFMTRMPRERVYWTYGDISMQVYDLTDVDSVTTPPSNADAVETVWDDDVCYRGRPSPEQFVDDATSRLSKTSESAAPSAQTSAAGRRRSYQDKASSPVDVHLPANNSSLESPFAKAFAGLATTKNEAGVSHASNTPDSREQQQDESTGGTDEADFLLRDGQFPRTCYSGQCHDEFEVQQPAGVQPTNVLEVLVNSRKQKAQDLLFETPIVELLSLKWMTYGYLGFTILLLLNLFYVILVTVVVYYRPLKLSQCRNSTDNMTDIDSLTRGCPWVPRSFLKGEAYVSTGDFLRLTGEIIVCLLTLVNVLLEIYDAYHLHDRGYFGKDLAESTYSLIRWVNCVLIFTAVILRLTDSRFETAVLSAIVILAWMFMLIFGRGFKLMGPYLIMISHMIVNDILRFFVLYTITLIAFGLGFYVLFQEAIPHQPLSFSNYGYSVVTLFRATLGLTDIELKTFEESTATALAIVYMLFFLVFTYLLLVNLLIAMMERTQDTLAKRQPYLWKLQVARSILLIERRLKFLFQKRMAVGRSGSKLNLNKGRRYLCLEFKEKTFKPFAFHSNDFSLVRQPTIISLGQAHTSQSMRTWLTDKEQANVDIPEVRGQLAGSMQEGYNELRKGALTSQHRVSIPESMLQTERLQQAVSAASVTSPSLVPDCVGENRPKILRRSESDTTSLTRLASATDEDVRAASSVDTIRRASGSIDASDRPTNKDVIPIEVTSPLSVQSRQSPPGGRADATLLTKRTSLLHSTEVDESSGTDGEAFPRTLHYVSTV